MSFVLALLLLVAVVNPPRRRAELNNDRQLVLAGAGLAYGALMLLGAVGEDLLDWLDVSGPTLRVAVGLVLVLRGVLDLVMPLPQPAQEPGETRSGWRAAAIPVFFPVLFRPELALTAVSVSVDGGLGSLAAGAALALALVVMPGTDRWARPMNVFVATGLIALAVDRLLDGVFAL